MQLCYISGHPAPTSSAIVSSPKPSSEWYHELGRSSLLAFAQQNASRLQVLDSSSFSDLGARISVVLAPNFSRVSEGDGDREAIQCIQHSEVLFASSALSQQLGPGFNGLLYPKLLLAAIEQGDDALEAIIHRAVLSLAQGRQRSTKCLVTAPGSVLQGTLLEFMPCRFVRSVGGYSSSASAAVTALGTPALVIRHLAAPALPPVSSRAMPSGLAFEAAGGKAREWVTAGHSAAEGLTALVTMIDSDGHILYQVWMG